MRRACLPFIASALLALALGSGALAPDAPAQASGWEEAARESYWYSRYNVEALLASKLGLLEDGRLLAPYASGDPAYVQTGSREWSPARADRTIATRALAWTAIALVGHAKQLAQLYQAGAVPGDEAARAVELGVRAARLLQFAHEKLRDPATGLHRPRLGPEGEPTGEPSALDQALMLWAYAELLPLTEQALYRGPISRAEAERRAARLFWAIWAYESAHPGWTALPLRNAALLLEALCAYAATLPEGPELTRALDILRERARALMMAISSAESKGESVPLGDQAAAMRALAVAARLLGDEALRRAALQLWAALQTRWDERVGAYRTAPDEENANESAYDYDVQTVGDLVGAFGAAIHDLGLVEARVRYAQFFEAVVKRARLMIAEGEEAGGGADGDPVPAPQDAGGPHGKAPVFVARIKRDPALGDWIIANSRFTTAGAMYLAFRMLGLGERAGWPYLGPPSHGLPTSPTAQLVHLRQQLQALRTQAERVPPERVEALRELFIALEARVQQLDERTGRLRALTEGLAQASQERAALRERVRALDEALQRARREHERFGWVVGLIGLGLVGVALGALGFALSLQRRLNALARQAPPNHVEGGVQQHDPEEPS